MGNQETTMDESRDPMKVTNKHFVLKTPIKSPFPSGSESFVVGTGCFWGTERGFWKLPGVITTAVGYCGGKIPHPRYKEVCSGVTGHNEAVLVVYDPTKISFCDVLKQFWESHDPTQGNGQGNDRGTQYRSGIYPTTKEQEKIAIASRVAYDKALKAAGKGMGPRRERMGYHPVTTEIVFPAPVFYYAEDYHQQYLAKPGSRNYCSAQPQGVSLPPAREWIPEGYKDEYAEKLEKRDAPCGS